MATTTSALPFVGSRAGGRAHRNLVVDRKQELRLFPSWLARLGLVALVVAYFAIPGYLPDADLVILCQIGIFAIGALGLNLLTGFAGQVSLGHATLVGAGGFAANWFADRWDFPILLYLPAAALVGFLLGCVIGPFALRLRGNYLAIVTLGLLFIGEHVFNNWRSVTGGNRGTETRGMRAVIGPLDFESLELGGLTYTKQQGMFWLIWALLALTAVLVKNIVRSRPGRALQAVRDRDVSAEVIGVSLARTKIAAFAASSALAAFAGGLYAVWKDFMNSGDFGGQLGLFLSITFVAMIIIGGVGTVMGSIIGAIVVIGGQELIKRNNDFFLFDPLIKDPADFTDDAPLAIGEFNNIVFGLAIILFLMIEPRGIAALWLRVKAYFLTWPFRY
jgi:branched-chain amino acid transport system permease protein